MARWRSDRWVAAVVWIGLGASALGCQNGGTSSGTNGPTGCVVEVPCDDDPNKTCTKPCKTSGAGIIGAGAGTAGDGGGTSSGSGIVDGTGTIVQATTTAFDEFAPYTGPITVVAPGVDTETVEVDAVNGSFTLKDAAAGFQWVLALDADGATGGVLSTYSLQDVGGPKPMVLPVIPVDVLLTIANQLGDSGLTSGQAQLVVQIVDELGVPLDGVEIAPLSPTFGFDIAPGEYSSSAGVTGQLGMVIMIDVSVPMMASAMVKLQGQYVDIPFEAMIALRGDTVTFAGVQVDTTP